MILIFAQEYSEELHIYVLSNARLDSCKVIFLSEIGQVETLKADIAQSCI